MLKGLLFKKITLFGWQLNAIASVCVGIGILLGIYIGAEKLISIFAINDVTKTWEYNSVLGGDYSYDSSLVSLGATSASIGVNRFSNSTFDTDLASWNSVSTYPLNDQYTTDRIAGAINGTSSEPTGGTRNVIDTNSKITITGSELSFATGAANNNGLWYSSINRTIGNIYVQKVITTNQTSSIAVGWDTNTSGDITDRLLFNSSGTLSVVQNNGSVIALSQPYAVGTYYVAGVMRQNGFYWFIKGGIYTDWRLLWISSVGNSAGIPAISNYSTTSIFRADDAKVIQAGWLPTGLAYDSFTSAGIAQTEITGADGFPIPASSWINNSTWSEQGGVLKNTPTANNGLVADITGSATSLVAFNGYLYAGTNDSSRLYRSQNGTTWEYSYTFGAARVRLFVVEGKIYAADGASGLLYESSDGANWSLIWDSTESSIYSFTYFNGYYYAGTGGNAVLYRSANLSSWEIAYDFSGQYLNALYVFDGYLYTGTDINGLIYRSSDGLNWNQVYDSPDNAITSFTNFNGVLYASSTGGGYVFKTSDGTTWTTSYDTPDFFAYGLKVFNNELYVGTASDGKIYKTANGTSWSLVYDAPYTYIKSFEEFGGALYANTEDTGVILKSTDGSIWYDASAQTGINANTTDVIISADLVVTSPYYHSGFILNSNDLATITEGVFVYISRTNATTGAVIGANKVISATESEQLLGPTTVTYSSGANLRVITRLVSGTTLSYVVYYNNAYVGAFTLTDSALLNNTLHGLYSNNVGNTFDNFSIFGAGVNGEYSSLPTEDLVVSIDNTIKKNGAGSAKLVAQTGPGFITQNINLNSTSDYIFRTYAYTNGTAVTKNDIEFYYNNSTATPSYTDLGAGWYLLSATIQGTVGSTNYGFVVKSGKTVYIDDPMLYKHGEYTIFNNDGYYNVALIRLDTFSSSENTPNGSSVRYQLCANDGDICESQSYWQYWNGSEWSVATNNTSNTNLASELTQAVMQSFDVTSKKISVKVILFEGTDQLPSINSVSVGMSLDTTPPTDPTQALFVRPTELTCDYDQNCWTNITTPKFRWTGSVDGETDIYGYCLYFGTDETANPNESKGKLGTSPISTEGTGCSFIVAENEVDLSTSGYLASAISNEDTFVTAENTYYLNIRAIDLGYNLSDDTATIRFRYDGIKPNNVLYISTASGNFSNVLDMNFAWPVSGVGISTDSESDIMGWQYQINSTIGQWKGTTHSDDLDLDYIPVGQNSYQLVEGDRLSINSGNNVVYFRTVDNAGNVSIDSTIRTGNLAYGGDAPYFGGADAVTVNPDYNTNNEYALSWPAATPAAGYNVTHYYYSVNTPPAATLATMQANTGSYFDNGTSRTVSARSLPGVIKGENLIYVIAVDDADTPNYSPSNYITGTFELDSTNPDNVGNLSASDSSIKSQSRWNVTLTWTEPVYKGAGGLTYLIYRSEDGSSFTNVGSSIGLSYVDNTPESRQYIYKVITKDTANALSSGTNTVVITPTGRWTFPPALDSGPTLTQISSKKALISWTTDRTADSKIAFGLSSGDYFEVEPSNSNQTTGHSIELSGLNPSTTYYYKAKWTDEDGNTGESEEKIFKTLPPPSVKNVRQAIIGLDYAIIKFTSVNASNIKVYYGKSTNFGGMQLLPTSTSESSYTVQLTGLEDGTKYFYKINTLDNEGNEYDGTILDFTTLPRPRISNVEIYEAKGTAQTTIVVNWETNTDVSSIVTYYPANNPDIKRDEVNVDYISGSHKMTIRGLLVQTKYAIQVHGVDQLGNEAVSDVYYFTTSTDSRPPSLGNLTVQTSIVNQKLSNSDNQKAQLVITWDTDELATSQVEIGEGSGVSYTQKSLEDSNLTYNHVIVLTDLGPSKVYHLRAISVDAAGNKGESIDTVIVTAKYEDNALNLVIDNILKMLGL